MLLLLPRSLSGQWQSRLLWGGLGQVGRQGASLLQGAGQTHALQDLGQLPGTAEVTQGHSQGPTPGQKVAGIQSSRIQAQVHGQGGGPRALSDALEGTGRTAWAIGVI